MLKFGFADRVFVSHRSYACVSFVVLDGGQCGRYKDFAEDVGRTLPGRGLALDPWDVVGLRTTASVWHVPEKYGPHGELFFLIKTKAVEFRPCVTAETLKACALIGLHMVAEESYLLVSQWHFSGCWKTGGGVAIQGILCGKATLDGGTESEWSVSTVAVLADPGRQASLSDASRLEFVQCSYSVCVCSLLRIFNSLMSSWFCEVFRRRG